MFHNKDLHLKEEFLNIDNLLKNPKCNNNSQVQILKIILILNMAMKLKLTKSCKTIIDKWTNKLVDLRTILEQTIQQKIRIETGKLLLKITVKMKTSEGGKTHLNKLYLLLLYKRRVFSSHQDQDHQSNQHHMVFLLLKIHNL